MARFNVYLNQEKSKGDYQNENRQVSYQRVLNRMVDNGYPVNRRFSRNNKFSGVIK